MKIARVFTADYSGRLKGDIHDIFPANQHPGTMLGAVLKEVEVADDFDPTNLVAVFDEEGAITFEEDATKAAAAVVAEKTKDILDRYNDMNAEVYAEMNEVFGTNKSDSATAFYETWKLMKEKPILFFEKGFLADKAVEGFALGAALNTVQKVEDYATARIEEAEAYSVWRMERIKQFQEEKAAILAG